MPSRSTTYECFCRLCTKDSSLGHDSKPRGKILPISQKAAHKARLAAEDEALRQAAVIDAATEAFKSLSLIDSSIGVTASSSAAVVSPVNRPTFNRPPKSERSKHTQTAHAVLDIVEQRIKACLLRIDQTPTLETLVFAEDELVRLQTLFSNVKRSVESVVARKAVIGPELSKLHNQISGLRQLRPAVDEPLKYDSSHHFNFAIDEYHPLSQIAIFIVVVAFIMMSLSRRLSELLLGLLSILVSCAFRSIDNNMTALPQFILNQIPRTLQTILSKFVLDGKMTTYIVCETCHFTYAPTFSLGSNTPTYPEYCSNRPLPDSDICMTKLVSDDKAPLKTFVYPHFHDYVAGLLAHTDLEDMIDGACDHLMQSFEQKQPVHHISDVFEAEFIRGFKGPDKTRLFVDRPGTEARLLFAFNFDFFAVEGMKLRGASQSCGILSAVCLNLPLSIRYKPENMYLAIVPGPDEPHLTEVNHYIRPFVDDLVDSWEKGVYYSRTANHPEGRMSRSAAILGVCDLPAARKISQLAGHSSNHFCSRCKCFHLSNVNRTDTDSPDWAPKHREEVLERAEEWKHAPSAKDQEKLFTRYGVRWSELWRLPYWEPSCMLSVDVMHCGFEGCAQFQFRSVLGLTQAKAEEKTDVGPSFDYDFMLPDEAYKSREKLDKDDLKDIASIHRLLVSPRQSLESDDIPEDNLAQLTTSLSRKRKKALAFVSDSVGAKPAVPERFTSGRFTKDHYAQGLTNWRRAFPLLPKSTPGMPKFATMHVMDRIREVIHDTDTPSWLRSVPYNFGHAAAGSLKADEWRTMSTIYLPIALVSVWGEGTIHPTLAIASSLRQVLDHTMDLVSAMSLVGMRTMTEHRMSSYHRYITGWVKRLPELHPEIDGRVNNHMAIHIYDFLCLFGPVHSWWCFPFERLVGQLQRLPTNHKFGELEVSMLTSFNRAGKLKRWLTHPDRSPIMKECEAVFDKAFGLGPLHQEESEDETVSSSAFRPVPSPLSKLFTDRRVALRARHRFDDTFFSRASTHVGNSLVLYHPTGDVSKPIQPASIQYIVIRENSEVVYVVRRQLPASSQVVDPFRFYPHFPAKIYSPGLSTDLEIIHPEWIMSHYARWSLDKDRTVILTLSRD